MPAKLTGKDEPVKGETVEVRRIGSLTIGRSGANDLTIRDKAVSRRHCRVDYDGELYWVVDADSHNGTLVNGKKVRKSLLYDGDVIQVGHVRLDFSVNRQQSAG